jgi:hypothetical protein
MEKNIYKIGKELFITSDEEIKGFDWCYDKVLNIVFQTDNHTNFDYVNQSDNVFKIILTTDQDLIKDGVQSIDDKFLEWFVKNPSCEFVEVEKWTDYKLENDKEVSFFSYKIIIPQEEPKQETLKEAARKYTRGVDFGTRNDYNAFIAGANWYKQNYNNWFDYSVTKPPIGVEVLAQSGNWINEDYNIRGIRIGFQNEDENGPFVSAKWDNYGDIYKDCEEYKPTKWKFIN